MNQPDDCDSKVGSGEFGVGSGDLASQRSAPLQSLTGGLVQWARCLVVDCSVMWVVSSQRLVSHGTETFSDLTLEKSET